MPRFITLAEVAAILQSGDFTRLLGGLEDDHLECKSAPYNLDQEREKMELAKDVSALANADGGIILIRWSFWEVTGIFQLIFNRRMHRQVFVI